MFREKRRVKRPIQSAEALTMSRPVFPWQRLALIVCSVLLLSPAAIVVRPCVAAETSSEAHQRSEHSILVNAVKILSRIDLTPTARVALKIQNATEDVEGGLDGLEQIEMLPGESGSAASEELGGGLKPIGSLTVNIDPPPGDLPTDVAGPLFASKGDIFQRSEYTPGSPRFSYQDPRFAFCHNPLYFEQVLLERYGMSLGIMQDVVSAGYFFGSVAMLPYKMVMDGPRQCVTTYGRGEAYRHQGRWPRRLGAASVQTGLAIGLILLLP